MTSRTFIPLVVIAALAALGGGTLGWLGAVAGGVVGAAWFFNSRRFRAELLSRENTPLLTVTRHAVRANGARLWLAEPFGADDERQLRAFAEGAPLPAPALVFTARTPRVVDVSGPEAPSESWETFARLGSMELGVVGAACTRTSATGVEGAWLYVRAGLRAGSESHAALEQAERVMQALGR